MMDGRTARRDKTRQKLIDAGLEIIKEGNWRPSGVEIARRAKLSQRSLFQIFGSTEGFKAFLIERHRGELWQLSAALFGPQDEPYLLRALMLDPHKD